MNLGVAIGLAVVTVVVMFTLVFVLARVETRMFDDVAVTPEEAEVPAVLEPAVELSRAA